VKSSGTVDAGGTKVLLRHRKDRIVLSKCYERKILVHVVVVMFYLESIWLPTFRKVIRRWEVKYHTRLDLLG